MSNQNTQDTRAITLHQPCASLMAAGGKKYETRSWAPAQDRVGKLCCIHAGKTFPDEGSSFLIRSTSAKGVLLRAGFGMPFKLPLGKIIAIGRLEAVWHIVPNRTDPLQLMGSLIMRERGGTRVRAVPFGQEYEFGNYEEGRYAWEFTNVYCLIDPIPVRGMQGIWPIPADAAFMIAREIRVSDGPDDTGLFHLWAAEVYSERITSGEPVGGVQLEDLYP